MFARILGGLLFIAAWVAMIVYSYQMVQMFGRWSWAESNLGGTRNALVLFGVLLMVLGMLMLFGVFSVANPADNIPQGFAEAS